ncbi:phospholipid transfer protein C2CD2L [Pelodytes ibericus]
MEGSSPEIAGFGLPELGFAALLLLFAASLITVLAWLLQVTPGARRPHPPGARALLIALCGFPSIRESWSRAWARALNREAARSRGSVQILFEEGTLLHPNAHITQVTCSDHSDNSMVFLCSLSADTVRFPVSVTQESPAAVSMDTYQVSLTLRQAQMEVCLQELPQEGLLVSWGFKEQPDIVLEVAPRHSRQSNDGDAELSTVQALIQDALLSAQPAMVFNLKARDGDMGLYDRLLRGSPSRAESPKLLLRQLCLQDLTMTETEVELKCEAELDSPWQRRDTCGVRTNCKGEASDHLWNEEMTFDLTPESKELCLRVWQIRANKDNILLGYITVALTLPRKELCGKHRYPLILSSPLSKITAPTISVEFLLPEPVVPRATLGPPTLRINITPTKKVEMDRTVMPDGTIVTTVTTIQSRPRLDGKIDSPSRSPSKVEVTENKPVVLPRSCSPGSSPSGSGGSPSSIKLDPVAETAIRQLTEPSNKPAKKTPTKRSTLIISGVSKVPLGQDEMALSLGYAASMDASLQESSVSGQDPLMEASEPMPSEVTPPFGPDTDDTTRSDISDRPSVEDLESETGSTGALETRSLKDHKVGFLRSGTKLLFRRRHREPGLSQSHDDLTDAASRKKSGSFPRRLLKRFSLKAKVKPSVNGSAHGEK